jgi:hypothetical protein
VRVQPPLHPLRKVGVGQAVGGAGAGAHVVHRHRERDAVGGRRGGDHAGDARRGLALEDKYGISDVAFWRVSLGWVEPVYRWLTETDISMAQLASEYELFETEPATVEKKTYVCIKHE